MHVLHLDCAGHLHLHPHLVLRKPLRIGECYTGFTEDEVDLAKVIKFGTETLFHLGVDFQVINSLITMDYM